MEEPPEDAPVLPHGWVRVGRYRWYTGWVALSYFATILICTYAAQLTLFLGRHLPLPVAVVTCVLLLGAVFGGTTLVQNLRYPQPWVNFDTGEFRSGRRTVPIAALTDATLTAVAPVRKKERAITLRFGAKGGPRAVFVLRDSRNRTIKKDTAVLLAELLRRSSIRMPESPHDPTGRFARYNFPGHLGKEDAVATVLDPPAWDDPLPVAQ
ncbi:hypothetical protein [Naasia aerilata]|uniref:PH (Pleckstrin Homology) domain-containing protein n=1 Tax=Naasia aerilata TaxID=1162966 RepID=A0ABN6XS49_9MICO|nr:hypothetical protein [Naasia aerilata]BDZ47694.1 hypothetical protein GCM10025866_36030 [Naasia aerilata]